MFSVASPPLWASWTWFARLGWSLLCHVLFISHGGDWLISLELWYKKNINFDQYLGVGTKDDSFLAIFKTEVTLCVDIVGGLSLKMLLAVLWQVID